jgi:hypothetical protein
LSSSVCSSGRSVRASSDSLRSSSKARPRAGCVAAGTVRDLWYSASTRLRRWGPVGQAVARGAGSGPWGRQWPGAQRALACADGGQCAPDALRRQPLPDRHLHLRPLRTCARYRWAAPAPRSADDVPPHAPPDGAQRPRCVRCGTARAAAPCAGGRAHCSGRGS